MYYTDRFISVREFLEILLIQWMESLQALLLHFPPVLANRKRFVCCDPVQHKEHHRIIDKDIHIWVVAFVCLILSFLHRIWHTVQLNLDISPDTINSIETKLKLSLLPAFN